MCKKDTNIYTHCISSNQVFSFSIMINTGTFIENTGLITWKNKFEPYWLIHFWAVDKPESSKQSQLLYKRYQVLEKVTLRCSQSAESVTRYADSMPVIVAKVSKRKERIGCFICEEIKNYASWCSAHSITCLKCRELLRIENTPTDNTNNQSHNNEHKITLYYV